MTQTSKPIIFFGNERLATGVTTAAPTLRGLITAGYSIAAVIANHEPAQSRQKRPLEVAEVAAEHGIPVWLPKRLSDISSEIAVLHPDVGILVAYGRIVPQSIIDLFPNGILNIHPSLLPRWRGSTPIETTILSGDETAGVSIMQLVQEMDAGPVLIQESVPLLPTITTPELTDVLSTKGAELLLQVLPKYLEHSLAPVPQDTTKPITFSKKLSKLDGILDFAKNATELEREIRAYNQWPKSTMQLAGMAVTVVAAHTVAVSGPAGTHTITDDEVLIHCAQDTLSLDIVKPASKSAMPIKAFLAGYRTKLS